MDTDVIRTVTHNILASIERAETTGDWSGVDASLREVFEVSHPYAVYVAALRSTYSVRDKIMFWTPLHDFVVTHGTEDIKRLLTGM